jgi:Ca2+-binding RTX toxin-like protein
VAGDALNRNDIAGDGITGMTDTSVPGQITVNLTGAASFAAYQNAIEAITFSSNSNNPTNADRVIHVTVNDGLVDSNVATTAVHVVPVNDPPNAGDENVISNFASGTSYTVPGWALLANDTDTDGPGPLTLTNVTESSSNFTAVLTAGNVVVTDSSNGSRSFTYTVSDGASPTAGTDTNSVSVTRDTTGTVDGNNSNTPDILVGDGASSTFDAGTGDDIVFGGGGDDTIVWNANTFGSTDGHDFVDGGSNTAIGDRAVITGNNSSETFRIYSNTDDWDNNALNGIESSAAHAGLTGLNASTEIVITRTVGNSTSVIAELDNVEEITINTRDVTANDGGGLNGGNVGNDTIQVFGNFSSTSLNYSTITINGDNGDDTVDITGLTSDHRIVFHGGGGSDHVEGTVRPQDVVDNQSGPPAGDDPSVPPGDDQQDQDSGDQQDDGNDATQVPLAHLGTDADDVMIGTLDDDVLAGVGGDDLILGDSGADTLKGGSGDDLVKGGAGDDVILGNEGNDDLFGGSGNDLMTGDAGDDRLFGDAGDDVLEGGAGSDTVYGGADNDRIVAKAGDGDDTYFGDTGEDTLDYSAISANIAADLGNGLMQHGSVSSSQSGTDATFGFENFIGGSGNDTITASSVANVMDGGGGNDTYVFHSAADADGDTIKGFQPGDKIDLSAIDANTGASGTQSFVLFAGNMFTSAGQVIVTQELKEGVEHTFVEGNTNNDTVADFKIDLGAGNQALTAADFNGVH